MKFPNIQAERFKKIGRILKQNDWIQGSFYIGAVHKLRGHFFVLFWPTHSTWWTVSYLSIDGHKLYFFWLTNPLWLSSVHIVCEWPHILIDFCLIYSKLYLSPLCNRIGAEIKSALNRSNLPQKVVYKQLYSPNFTSKYLLTFLTEEWLKFFKPKHSLQWGF